MTKFTTAGGIFFIFASSLASAIPIVGRNVYVPQILTPIESDVWTIGERRTVTWNVTEPPTQITNSVGRILLRKDQRTLDITLADNFDILAGAITVTVPKVTPGEDYRIVLFGDSGNWSPPFSIDIGNDTTL